jgi:eukaryotic-like serine/threonine-protein kinase
VNGQGSNPVKELPGKWSEIKALFAEALEVDPAIRASWLGNRCRGNPALASELASLLEHDHSNDRFLETPAWRLNDQWGVESGPVRKELGIGPGTIVGSWSVVDEICTGGMGTVYLAERTLDDDDQPVRQRAAIKIIRARMDAKLLAGRFRRERRILAQLNHPFIARFLEGGTLENGLPYFALDYVEGEPIDEYCRNRQLGLAETLHLFCKVCSAVAYAHRNLVVHRDLKPSNILVTADRTPRLLDFGIAKLLAEEEESSNQTSGVGPCTPRYSSPEQIRGEPVTTASDIFALGIILYELVFGSHPFDPAKESEPAPAIDVLRRICEEEPRSGRVQYRQARSRGGDRNFRLSIGDLESIILRALQKSPADRYQSVEYMIDDIQNLLDRRPVLARPQSWWYRARTLIRRHPTATTSTSVAALIGIIALGFILASDRAMRRERDYALQQRELAASSAQTMINDLASTLESMAAPVDRRLELLKRVVTVFDKIDATRRSDCDPARSAALTRAEVRTQVILARALEELGDFEGAIHRTEAAESQTRELLSRPVSDVGDQLTLAKVLLEKCRALSNGGKVPAAMENLGRVFPELRELEAEKLPGDCRWNLERVFCDALILRASLREELADPEDTLKLLTDGIRYGQRAYEAKPSDRDALDSYAHSLERLGSFYFQTGQIGLIREPVRRALALRRKAANEAPADIDLQQRSERAVARWGFMIALLGPEDEQVPVITESLSLQRKFCALDPNNFGLLEDLIRMLGNLGVLLMDRRDYTGAKAPLREALDIGKRLGYESRCNFEIDDYLHTDAFALSVCCSETGDFEEALRINRELLGPLTETLEVRDPDISNNRFRKALSCYGQAEASSAVGNWKEAQLKFSEAVRYLEENVRVRDFPVEREIYGDSLARLGDALGQNGEMECACQKIQQGLKILYGSRDGGRVVPRCSILSDIYEAEQALKSYEQQSKNNHRLASSASQ